MITLHYPDTLIDNTANRPKMLVVDDELNNRLILQRLFEKKFDVVMAEDGLQAVDHLGQEPFDLVLLDIMMPKMNGIEVLHHIRETRVLNDMPVILVSALSEKDAIIQGLRAGANDYITKPIDIDMLLTRVQTQLMMKQLLDERRRHIRALENAQTFKDRCLQMVSHDLKGPLGNLRIAHVLIGEELPAHSNVRTYLGVAEQSVDLMQEVIEELLDLAALKYGQLRLNLSSVDVDNVISRVVEQHRLSAAQKEIDLISETGRQMICADEVLFSQALNNLISNAIKYSPFQTMIRIWTETCGNVVRVWVADQGPGIPEHERERLFTQFGKLTARPTNGETSTGLGLWIVKMYVEAQQGQVGVECPPEGGSRFWLELPTVSL